MDPAVEWVSVSGLLDAASNELEVGQLLHTSVFSLFEAMSAVEIGNPKMDAGARPKGNTMPLEQREMQLELTPEQLVGIMDHLLCLEATWHNGGALPCTLYSSIYMMQPDRTAANVALSAYCHATQALCAEVNHLIMTGCVCEEEDFNAHIAGLPLEHATTAAGAAATGATPAPQHSSSSSSSSNSTEKLLALISHAIDAQEASPKQQQQQQAAAAIVARLQFRKLILQALIKIKRRQKQDLDQAAKLLLKAQAELAAVRESVGLGTQHAGLGFDEDMNSHLVPAVPPRAVKVFSPDQAVEYFESLLGQLLRVCHITQVNSYRALKDYLVAFTSQPMCALSRSAMHIQVSYNAWNPQQQQQQPLQDAASAAAGSSSSTYDAKHHQHHIASPTHSPGAAAAAPAVNGSAVAEGSTSGTTVQHTSSSSSAVAVPHWCLSPAMIRAALQLSQDEELGDDGELFLEQAVIATSNVVQALLMNRSRCRRRLRRGLEDWANLYQHALNADNSPQFQAYMAVHGWVWKNEHPGDLAGPLATWVECETCFSMVTHLLMGFELSLYEPADYSMIYWYVDLLCMVWQQGSKLLHEQQPALVTLPARSSSSSSSKSAAGLGGAKLPSKSGGKSNTKSNSHKSPGKHTHQSAAAAASPAAAAAAAGGPTKEDYLLLNLMLEIRRNLSMGLLRTMMSLQMLGMYKAPELPFNSEAQRFDQRFASFSLLMRPDPLSHDQFVKSTDVEGVTVGQLLARAAESFKRAQQASAFLKTQVSSLNPNKQQLAEAAAAERVAATNAVAATLLSRAAGSSSSSSKGEEAAAAAPPQFKPHFEFGISKMFPTLTLKSATAK